MLHSEALAVHESRVLQHIPTSGSILHGVLPIRKFMMSSLILPMFKGANCLKVEGGGVNCLKVEGGGANCLKVEGGGANCLKVEGGGANCLEGGRVGAKYY